MRPRRLVAAGGGGLVLEVAEGGGHVLEQLVEVGLDLGFAVFYGVLGETHKIFNSIDLSSDHSTSIKDFIEIK